MSEEGFRQDCLLWSGRQAAQIAAGSSDSISISELRQAGQQLNGRQASSEPAPLTADAGLARRDKGRGLVAHQCPVDAAKPGVLFDLVSPRLAAQPLARILQQSTDRSAGQMIGRLAPNGSTSSVRGHRELHCCTGLVPGTCSGTFLSQAQRPRRHASHPDKPFLTHPPCAGGG